MADLKITVEGAPPVHARDRIVAVEAFTTSLSQSVGEDPADAMFVLLVSMMNIARACDGEGTDIKESIIGTLDNVMTASEGMFPMKPTEHH